MDISQEKEFIYEMMRDITAERRRLTDTYFGLKNRLEELNELEEKGLKQLSVKGYADLYQQQQEQQLIRSNVEREAIHIVDAMQKSNSSPSESTTSQSQTLPSSPARPHSNPNRLSVREQMDQQRQQRYSAPPAEPAAKEAIQPGVFRATESTQKEEEKTKKEREAYVQQQLEVEPPQQKAETKEQKNIKKQIKKERTYLNGRQGRHSLEKMESMIVDILKENGEEMQLYEIYDVMYDKLDGNFYDRKNFQKNVMYRIKKHSLNIENPRRGFYKYKPRESKK